MAQEQAIERKVYFFTFSTVLKSSWPKKVFGKNSLEIFVGHISTNFTAKSVANSLINCKKYILTVNKKQQCTFFI
jgi:hypothetical protein